MKHCAICPHQSGCLTVGACFDDINAPLIASGQFSRRTTPTQFVCNLYSITTNQAAIVAPFRVADAWGQGGHGS